MCYGKANKERQKPFDPPKQALIFDPPKQVVMATVFRNETIYTTVSMDLYMYRQKFIFTSDRKYKTTTL